MSLHDMEEGEENNTLDWVQLKPTDYTAYVNTIRVDVGKTLPVPVTKKKNKRLWSKLTRRKHHDFITRRQHCVNIFTPGENGRFDNAESLFSGDKCLHIENQSPLNDFNFLSINLVSS